MPNALEHALAGPFAYALEYTLEAVIQDASRGTTR